MRYAIVIEHGENNLSAYAPDLPGCVATGRTVEDTIGQMREAIEFHLEGLAMQGIAPPPAVTRVADIEISEAA